VAPTLSASSMVLFLIDLWPLSESFPTSPANPLPYPISTTSSMSHPTVFRRWSPLMSPTPTLAMSMRLVISMSKSTRTDPLCRPSTPIDHSRFPFSTEDSRFFSREEGLIPTVVILSLNSFSVFLASMLFILGLLLIDFIYSSSIYYL
jgi:hypothetical protein